MKEAVEITNYSWWHKTLNPWPEVALFFLVDIAEAEFASISASSFPVAHFWLRRHHEDDES